MIPASYPPNDGAESRAIAVVEALIDHDLVKTSFAKRDKFPNIDGFVEIVKSKDRGIPIGKLDVQIKTLPKDSLSYQCPASLVAYAETVTTLPVLLLCADYSANRAYWKHVHAGMPEFKANQDSFVVHFDEQAESIDDRLLYVEKWRLITEKFRKRLSGQPDSVEEALKNDLETFVARNPDWNARINIVDSKKIYHLEAKNDSEIKLEVPAEMGEALQDLVNYGKPLLIAGEGIKMSGSLNLGHEIASIGAKPSNEKKTELFLWCEGDPFRLTLPGTMTGGRAGVRFACELEGAPFAAETRLPKELLQAKSGNSVMFVTWNFEKWSGFRLLELPYFQRLEQFFKAVDSGREIRHEFIIDLRVRDSEGAAD